MLCTTYYVPHTNHISQTTETTLQDLSGVLSLRVPSLHVRESLIWQQLSMLSLFSFINPYSSFFRLYSAQNESKSHKSKIFSKTDKICYGFVKRYYIFPKIPMYFWLLCVIFGEIMKPR